MKFSSVENMAEKRVVLKTLDGWMQLSPQLERQEAVPATLEIFPLNKHKFY